MAGIDYQEPSFLGRLSFEWCGEGELRTPTHENRKSRFLMHLTFQGTKHNSKISAGKIEEVSNTGNRPKKCLYFQLYLWRRGRGLYCSFFRNTLVFCHFAHNACICCRLRPRLTSRIRLSSALQSLLWTSKVPKKSNMSNKFGFLFRVYSHCRGLEFGKSSANFPGVADRIASLGTLPAPSTVACRAAPVQILASSSIQTTWLARRGHRFNPNHVHQRYSQTRRES
jgi:hypothetical protein